MKSEIKVVNVHIETPLIISENVVRLLIVENASEYYNTVKELINITDGGSGNFVFYRDGVEIAADKTGCMVADLYSFGANDKKVLSLLYKKLAESVYNEYNFTAFNELNSKLLSFADKLTYNYPFELDYSEIQANDFFKVIGLKFAEEYGSLLEKLICYINIMTELKDVEFFVFVNLKSVLSDENLQELYKHCRLEKIGLLLVESAKIRPLAQNESAVIITEDLCEILENY